MSAHAAFAQMLAARAAALVLMVAGFAALGRLLPPEAFGRFALAGAAFALAQAVSDFGLRHYLVRERDLGPEVAGRAMGLALALSSAIALGVAALALALGGGPLHPETAAALLILAPALVLGAVGMVADALLRRRLDFRLVSRLEVARTGTDAGVAVALAWAGFGAPALAGGMLASRAATTVAVVALGGHARALRPRLGGWGRFGGFGARYVATDLLPSGAALALNAALAASLGAATLGLYNRAEAIRAMLDRTLIEGLKPVVLPVLSRSLEAGWSPADLHARKVDYLCALCWPVFGLIALMAEPIVRTLLGAGWEEVVPAVRILALSGFLAPFTKMAMKFFIAVDRLDLYLRVQVVHVAARLALAGAGALVSLEAFCLGLAAALALKAALLRRAVGRRFGQGRPGAAAILGGNAVVTAAALAGPAALLLWAPDAPAALRLALALPLAGAGWLGGLALARHALLADLRAAAARRPRSRRAAPSA